MTKFLSRLKLFFFLLGWACLLFEVLFNTSFREEVSYFLTAHPVLAPFLLVAIQIVFASFGLPCSALTVMAGALWGVIYGVAYSTIATILSSVWTFSLGRYLLSRWVEKKVEHGWYLKIQQLIDKYHWKAAAFAHANPVFPGSSLGYIFGLSQIGFKAFLSGVLLGTLPLQIILVGVGHLSVKSVTSNFNFWVVLLLAIALLTATFYKKLIALAFPKIN